jgi:hypothetical protein
MAKAKTQSSRGRKQDRARVAGGQDYEVVKKVGSSRKRVERRLGRYERDLEWWAEAMSHLVPGATPQPKKGLSGAAGALSY